MYYIQAVNNMKKFQLLFLKNKFVPFLFHFSDCLCQEKILVTIAAVVAYQPADLTMDKPWARLDGFSFRAISAIIADYLIKVSHCLFTSAGELKSYLKSFSALE